MGHFSNTAASELTLFTWDGGFTKGALNSLLKWANDFGVSDVFIETDEPVYIKYLGEMLPVSHRPLRRDEVSELLRVTYQSSGPDLLRSGQYLRFGHQVLLDDDTLIRFRVTARGCNTLVDDNGIEIVFRSFPKEPPPLDSYAFPKKLIRALCSDKGLDVVTGSTGHGKSTTLAAFVYYNAQHFKDRIITFEDPPEFPYKEIPDAIVKVTQSEVPLHLSDYNEATNSALRSAPDKIYVGEVRERGVARELVRLALTGHKVWTTFHADRVELTIPQLVSLFASDEQHSITDNLLRAMSVIMNQQLVQRPGGRGRMPLHSYLVFDSDTRASLEVGLADINSLPRLLESAVKTQGLSLFDDAKRKFRDGFVDVFEYQKLVDRHGNAKDMECVTDVAGMLRDQNRLSDEEYKLWVRVQNDYE